MFPWPNLRNTYFSFVGDDKSGEISERKPLPKGRETMTAVSAGRDRDLLTAQEGLQVVDVLRGGGGPGEAGQCILELVHGVLEELPAVL